MSTTRYFIRSRGKISGPFDLATLQKLVRRSALSRLDEVSPDRITWSKASEFVDVFPARAANAAHRTVTDEAPPPQPSTAVAAHQGMGMYCYVQNGEAVGPVPMLVLQSLARNGTLGPKDVCWQEGASLATSADALPALAQIFSTAGQHYGIGSIPQADRQRAPRVLARTYWICQVAGIVIGCVMLLFLNLPIGAEHENTIWWWDTLKLPHNGAVAVLLLFVFFTGIATLVLGALVHGLVRAWTFVGFGGVSFILFLILGVNNVPTDGGFFWGLIVPYLAAALIGVSLFRSQAPDVKIGKIFQAILGGCLLLCILIVAIEGFTIDSGPKWHDMMGNDVMPGWAVLALTTCAIGSVAALVSGILGLVGLRQTFSSGANATVIGSAIASIGLPYLGVMIAISGLVNMGDSDNKGLWIFLSFRICTVFSAFVALIAVGVTELFNFLYFAPLVPIKRVEVS